MKRILHILRSIDPAMGGPTEGQLQICKAYSEMGGHSEVVTLDAPDAPWRAGWPVRVHALAGRGGYGWTPRLGAWLREHAGEFDAVIVHGLWQWQGMGAWLALGGVGVPYFMMPHGMLDPWFQRVWPLKHARKAVYWKLIEHRVMRDAAAVIFTCEEERRLGREVFQPWGVRAEEIVVLGTVSPPGDAAVLRECFWRRFPELRGKRVLLFLSRVHKKKGCELLIEAFRRVAPAMHLVLVGPCADAQYLASLMARAAGFAVTFTGPLYGAEKWGALAAAEVFVLPSHQENFGIAVAESLASGTPVLISNKVNIWREIEADGAGLVAADDVAGTVRLLERWLVADHAAMRVAAARCFATRFDIRSTAANLAAIVGKYC